MTLTDHMFALGLILNESVQGDVAIAYLDACVKILHCLQRTEAHWRCHIQHEGWLSTAKVCNRCLTEGGEGKTLFISYVNACTFFVLCRQLDNLAHPCEKYGRRLMESKVKRLGPLCHDAISSFTCKCMYLLRIVSVPSARKSRTPLWKHVVVGAWWSPNAWKVSSFALIMLLKVVMEVWSRILPTFQKFSFKAEFKCSVCVHVWVSVCVPSTPVLEVTISSAALGRLSINPVICRSPYTQAEPVFYESGESPRGGGSGGAESRLEHGGGGEAFYESGSFDRGAAPGYAPHAAPDELFSRSRP